MRGVFIGALLVALAGRAQNPPREDMTHFEAASVRLSPPPQGLPPGAMPPPIVKGGVGSSDPGQVSYQNVALGVLAAAAYGIRGDQLSGPVGLLTEHLDVIAKIPAGATPEQFKRMLQNLLLERFHLQFHHESRILPVYTLTVAKGGPKFKESSKVAEPPELPPGTVFGKADENGFPTFPPGRSALGALPSNGHMRITGQKIEISKLSSLLMLDHPVVDQTGLAGEYDFKLDFAMATRLNTQVADNASDPAPPVFAAVEDQLGLKLESKKLPFDVMVIDHLDKEPTAN
jgi:uncharacterized protein (TIGR03435 family)